MKIFISRLESTNLGQSTPGNGLEALDRVKARFNFSMDLLIKGNGILVKLTDSVLLFT